MLAVRNMQYNFGQASEGLRRGTKIDRRPWSAVRSLPQQGPRVVRGAVLLREGGNLREGQHRVGSCAYAHVAPYLPAQQAARVSDGVIAGRVNYCTPNSFKPCSI
jgi:hypothetical protein